MMTTQWHPAEHKYNTHDLKGDLIFLKKHLILAYATVITTSYGVVIVLKPSGYTTNQGPSLDMQVSTDKWPDWISLLYGK